VRPIPLPPAEEHGRGHVDAVSNRAEEEGQRLLDADADSECDGDGDRIEDPDAL
jgi:hypothetical protein